jgi:hypothetical protein
VDTTSRWEDELGRWLEPFLDRLGHKARRRMRPLYGFRTHWAGRSQERPANGGAARKSISDRCHHDLSTEKARKPRKHYIPDMSPVSAETMLVGVKWQKISWRGGTKGPPTCLFAARRVRIADGPKHRVFDKGVERMPGDEVWILANDDRAASRSTTSRICPLTFRLRRWQLPSRRGGSVNRRISS